MSVKLCKDCKYFRKMEYLACFHPKLGTSLVTGEIKDRPAESMRKSAEGCGPAGHWWEQRPVSMTWVNKHAHN